MIASSHFRLLVSGYFLPSLMPIIRCHVPTVPTRLCQSENSNRGCSLRYLPGLILRLPVSVPIIPCVIYPRMQTVYVHSSCSLSWLNSQIFLLWDSDWTCYANWKFYLFTSVFFVLQGTVRRSTDGDFIHANVDIDLIIGIRGYHEHLFIQILFFNKIQETYRFFPHQFFYPYP